MVSPTQQNVWNHHHMWIFRILFYFYHILCCFNCIVSQFQVIQKWVIKLVGETKYLQSWKKKYVLYRSFAKARCKRRKARFTSNTMCTYTSIHLKSSISWIWHFIYYNLIQTQNSHTDNTYHIKLIFILVNHKQELIQFILQDKLTKKWLMIFFFFIDFFVSLPVLDWNIWAMVLKFLRSFLFYTVIFFYSMLLSWFQFPSLSYLLFLQLLLFLLSSNPFLLFFINISIATDFMLFL